MSFPPPSKWVVLFDTNALLDTWKYQRNLKSIFDDSCEVVIPYHVIAELDTWKKRDAYGANHVSNPAMNLKPQPLSEVARNVASDLADFLPRHMERGRIVSEEAYLKAKNEAEQAATDPSQASISADNRILIFVRRILDGLGKDASLLFVTSDKLLRVSACYQLGSARVAPLDKWESIVKPKPKLKKKPAVPTPIQKSILPSIIAPDSVSISSKSTVTVEEDVDPEVALFLEHLKVLGSVSEKDITKQLKEWEEVGIILPDNILVAYYIADKRNKLASKKASSCMDWNGLAAGCKSTCVLEHKCLFCGDPDHGWYSNDCVKFQRLSAYRRQFELTEEEEWNYARFKAAAAISKEPVGSQNTVSSATVATISATVASTFQKPTVKKSQGPPPTSAPLPLYEQLTPQPKAVQISLKLDPLPKNKAELDMLFASNDQHQEQLKPLLTHIKKLAFGKTQPQPLGSDDVTFSRYLAYKANFEDTYVCRFFNDGEGCQNQGQCSHEHKCLYCGSKAHGWSACPGRQVLESLITEIFDPSRLPYTMTPNEVVELLVSACLVAAPGESKAIDKFSSEMSSVNSTVLQQQVKDYRSKGFKLPECFQSEFTARMMLAHRNKTSACFNFNALLCKNAGCTYKHVCAHCDDASGTHGWFSCEKRLDLSLELIGKGFSSDTFFN